MCRNLRLSTPWNVHWKFEGYRALDKKTLSRGHWSSYSTSGGEMFGLSEECRPFKSFKLKALRDKINNMNWNCTGRNYQSTQDSAEDNNLIQTIAEEEVLRLTKFQLILIWNIRKELHNHWIKHFYVPRNLKHVTLQFPNLYL